MLYPYSSIWRAIQSAPGLLSLAIAILVFALAPVDAQTSRKVLFLTHSAGFRHDSIPVAREVLERLDPRLAVVSTEDVSYLTASRLAEFDAVFFFTSGELPVTNEQKADLLEYVRSGKGFGGAHSATDTFYTWPEYGELIGARFDGHPWVHEARVDIEDPQHPASGMLAPAFRITEEFYQFREFSRERVRVLMTLGADSVDLQADGVHREDRDFALAWTQTYGRGRVFYTALGHFAETWRDERFQESLRGALLWLTRQVDAEGESRMPVKPEISKGGVVNAFSYLSGNGFVPGEIISVFGRHLSTGSAVASRWPDTEWRLAGTQVSLGGRPMRLYYASPGQINAVVPPDTPPGGHMLRVSVGPADNYVDYAVLIKSP